MGGEQPVITVFGDSHSKFFQPSQFLYRRMGFEPPLPYRINGASINAASVAGFRPKKTKLSVKEQISEALPNSRHMILAFGQVDLELGFYYRNAIKGEEYSPELYTDWLIDIYATFLDGLDAGNCELALKGVNLTVLDPVPFATRYVSRIAREGTNLTVAKAEARVRPFILSEVEQNKMHLDFNEKLRDFAIGSGAKYFDFTHETGIPENGRLRLADEFRPGPFDHHLADTLPVRSMHYEGAGKVFGLR